MDVESGGGTLFFKAFDPRGVLVLVAILVHWCHIHQEDVCRVRVQVK